MTNQQVEVNVNMNSGVSNNPKDEGKIKSYTSVKKESSIRIDKEIQLRLKALRHVTGHNSINSLIYDLLDTYLEVKLTKEEYDNYNTFLNVFKMMK